MSEEFYEFQNSLPVFSLADIQGEPVTEIPEDDQRDLVVEAQDVFRESEPVLGTKTPDCTSISSFVTCNSDLCLDDAVQKHSTAISVPENGEESWKALEDFMEIDPSQFIEKYPKFSLEQTLLLQLLHSMINDKLLQKLGINPSDVHSLLNQLLSPKPTFAYKPMLTLPMVNVRPDVQKMDVCCFQEPDCTQGENAIGEQKFLIVNGEKSVPNIFDAISLALTKTHTCNNIFRALTHFEMTTDPAFDEECRTAGISECDAIQGVLDPKIELQPPIVTYYLSKAIGRQIVLHSVSYGERIQTLAIGCNSTKPPINMMECDHRFYVTNLELDRSKPHNMYPFSPSPYVHENFQNVGHLRDELQPVAKTFYSSCNFCCSYGLQNCCHVTIEHVQQLESFSSLMVTGGYGLLTAENVMDTSIDSQVLPWLPSDVVDNCLPVQTTSNNNSIHDAISLLMFHDTEHQYLIRRLITSHLATNESKFKDVCGLNESDFQKLKSNVQSLDSPGDSATIVLLSHLLKRPICVYDKQTGWMNYNTKTENSNPPLFVLKSNADLFQALLPKTSELGMRVMRSSKEAVIHQSDHIGNNRPLHNEIFPVGNEKHPNNFTVLLQDQNATVNAHCNSDIDNLEEMMDVENDTYEESQDEENQQQEFGFPLYHNNTIYVSIGGKSEALTVGTYYDNIIGKLNLKQSGDTISVNDTKNFFLNVLKDELYEIGKGPLGANIPLFVEKTSRFQAGFWKSYINDKINRGTLKYKKTKYEQLRVFEGRQSNREMVTAAMKLMGIPSEICSLYETEASKAHSSSKRNENRGKPPEEKKERKKPEKMPPYFTWNMDVELPPVEISSSNDMYDSVVNENITSIAPDNITTTTKVNDHTTPNVDANRNISVNENLETELPNNKKASENQRQRTEPEERSKNTNINLSEYEKEVTNIARSLNVPEETFCYKPPENFQFSIPYVELSRYFDEAKSKFIPGNYAVVIDKYLNAVQKCCCFKSTHTPYYSRSKNGFATIKGECGCGLEFKITVPKKPTRGEDTICDVKSVGEFKLIQESSVCRPIRGLARQDVRIEASSCQPAKLFYERLEKTTPFRALHNNFMQHSVAVLHNISSEAKVTGTVEENPFDDIETFNMDLKRQHSEKRIKGFVHNSVRLEDSAMVEMFSDESLRLLHALRKTDDTVLHFDATGSVVTQKRLSSKKMLLYLGVVKSSKYTFPLCETLSQRGRAVDISNMLSSVKHEIDYNYGKSRLADVAVVDFSFAMIHGVMKGLNCMTLQDYLKESMKVLTTQAQFSQDRTLIYLCSSHLIHSFSQLLTKHHISKDIKWLAKHALARIQESRSIEEFTAVIRTVCEVFDSKNVDPGKLSKLTTALLNGDMMDDYNKSDEDLSEIMDEFDPQYYTQLRESSPVFHLFVRERKQLQQLLNYSHDENPVHSPQVLDLLQNHYIPYAPLYCSMMSVVTGRCERLRFSNAAIEGEFNFVKNIFHDKKKLGLHVFVRSLHHYQQGKLTGVLHTAMKSSNSKKGSRKNKENSDVTSKEGWNRTQKRTGVPLYFRQSNTFNQDRGKLICGHHTLEDKSDAIQTQPPPNRIRNFIKSLNPFPKPQGQKISEPTASVIDKQDSNYFYAKLGDSSTENRMVWLSPLELYRLFDDLVDNTQMDFFVEYLTGKHKNSKFQVTRPHFVSKQPLENLLGYMWTTSRGQETSPVDTLGYGNDKLILQNVISLHALLYEHHWVLGVIDRPSTMCIIFDSLPQIDKSKFQTELFQHFIPQFLPSGADVEDWMVHYKYVPRQGDTTSCGLYVIKCIDAILAAGTWHVDIDEINNPYSERCSLVRDALYTTHHGRTILTQVGDDNDALKNAVRSLCPTLLPK